MTWMKTDRRLCDDKGMVSHELVGDPIFPTLTFIKQINNLRAQTSPLGEHRPVEPFLCTGAAHLAGMEIRCTSPAHQPTTFTARIGERWYIEVPLANGSTPG